MFEVYKRLIALSPKSAAMIAHFADYLRIFSPDWEAEAVEMERCLQDGDIAAAANVATQVSYEKYQ